MKQNISGGRWGKGLISTPLCTGVLRTYQHPCMYRGADKSLTQPGMKQATVTDMLFIIIIGGILIIFIYIYNNTSIKRNILNIKQNISGSRSGKGLINTPACTGVLISP